MGDVGNNGAYARLRAQATSMRRKAESVGNKLQAIAEGIAKKYGARVTPINFDYVQSIIDSKDMVAIQVKINDLHHNQSRAKKYGFQKQYEKCTTALAMMGKFFPHEEG